MWLCHEITDPLGEWQGGLRGRRRQGACPTKVLNGMVSLRQLLSFACELDYLEPATLLHLPLK